MGLNVGKFLGNVGKGVIKVVSKTPKSITGILLTAAGIGISTIPVPVAQAVGGKIAYSGAAVFVGGLTSKAVKFKKAEKGKKWVAITENEREALKKIRKNKNANKSQN